MKIAKSIIGVLAITFALTSCSKNSDELETVATTQTNSTPKFKVRGDNKYDVLGFAFDATGPYLDQMRTILPVIDVKKMQDSTGLVISDDPVHQELDIKSGSDAKTLLTKYNTKFTLAGAIPIGGVPFTGSLSTEFSGSNTITSKYSYAIADMNVYVSHHAIKKYTDMATLQKYLTSTFVSDLETKTPEQIISLYGTHVYTDIYTGGKMSFKYKSYVNNATKESSVSYGAKVGVTAAANTSLSLSSTTTYTVTASNIFQQEFMSYNTIGGTGASPMGTWTPGSGTSAPINFNQWSSTVSKTNENSLQLIDIGDNSLMAIYEFVADPVKKAALKTAVDNYILSKTINVVPVVPLYRYNYNGNHLYTTDWTEIGSGAASPDAGWFYEGIAAFVCATQQPNTVPFYRFYRKIGSLRDHYYTTVYSSGSAYTYEKIQCYVYSTNASNTVAFHQYWNSSIRDHFYTTDQNGISSNWSYNGVCCYVVEGTR